MTPRMLAIAATLFTGCIGTAATAADLAAPFTVRAAAPSARPAACAAVSAPVMTLAVPSKYGNDGPRRDTIDTDGAEQAQAALAPLRAFTAQIVRQANHYSKTGDAAAARCVLAGLAAWADAGALRQMSDANAQFERGSTLAGLSLALMQVAPALEKDQQWRKVTGWMNALARQMTDYFDGSTKLAGSRNNHRDWAALAAAGVAVAGGDHRLLDWSAARYRDTVCGATAQGGLPLELARGQKALDYHLFSLDALVPLAAILDTNGVAAFDMCDGALHRIVKFTLDGVSDPSPIALLAGKPQHTFDGGLPTPSQVAFLEVYQRHFPGKAPLQDKLLALRPLYATNLGGDQTLLYRR